jgi:hypothetical protein
MKDESPGVDIDRIHSTYRSREPVKPPGDDGDPAKGVVLAIPLALLVWALIALGAVAYKLW